MKKLFGILLALTMVLSLGVPALAAEGELRNTDDLTEIHFKTTVRARYMRFTALSPHRGNEKWATMAELQPIHE